MSKKIQSLFVKEAKRIAKSLGVEPYQLTKTEFFLHNEGDIKEWDLRKIGGYNALKNLHFPEPKDLKADYGSRLVRSARRKLEKDYGTRDFIQDEILNNIKELLEKNPIRMHKPVKTKAKSSKKKTTRTIVAHLSDTHYGTNIDTKEMAGINEYNWTIAARRTALFAEQIANYKRQYRNETDLVLVINGDLIGGLIHNTEWGVDLWTIQFMGAVDILTQMISYLASQFNKVTVEFTTGNHGRLMSKVDKGRATMHKWDSLESTIGLSTKYVLEAKHKNITMNIPTTPFNIAEIQGHKFFISHGDTVFSTGNVGSSLNMKSINTQIAKLNSSELGGKDQKFAAVMFGHVHSPLAHLTESGCMLIINGCLSGTDPFAQSIGIFQSNPTQQLLEVTKDHAVGDMRFIQVGDADKQERLDSIIKPFKGSLE